MIKKACRTCSTIILVLLTNNITAFWCCRWSSRCRFLNSLLKVIIAVVKQLKKLRKKPEKDWRGKDATYISRVHYPRLRYLESGLSPAASESVYF